MTTWREHCGARCKLIKELAEPFVWYERPNHAGAFSASAGFLDANKATIPGLSVLFEYQRRIFGEYYKYALLDGVGSRRYRALVIEAMPEHKRGHTEPGLEIYGSHILLGDPRAGSYKVRKVITALDISQHLEWIERFRRHVVVVAGSHNLEPISGELFAPR